MSRQKYKRNQRQRTRQQFEYNKKNLHHLKQQKMYIIKKKPILKSHQAENALNKKN